MVLCHLKLLRNLAKYPRVVLISLQVSEIQHMKALFNLHVVTTGHPPVLMQQPRKLGPVPCRASTFRNQTASLTGLLRAITVQSTVLEVLRDWRLFACESVALYPKLNRLGCTECDARR
jgi:hypothetical protein